MDFQLWKVIGGVAKGGVLVRSGKELASNEEADRLSTGSIVKELALEEERLQYEKVSGNGPPKGWVSIRTAERDLLVRVAADEATQYLKPLPGKVDKIRILALHGKCSNSNIMKVQCAQLKTKLRLHAEWVFLDGNILYDPEKETTPHYEPTEFEKQVSRGQPFMQWYNHGLKGGYERVDEGLDHIRKCLKEQGPFNILLCFSMASNTVSMLLDKLRKEGAEVPWQLNVFFNGGIPRDKDYVVEEPFQLPTVKVHGGSNDPFWKGGEPSLKSLYTDLLELGHEDGHTFPKTLPRAAEIYNEVADEIKRRFGLSLEDAPARG